ncbi:MAG: PepSY-like domain-containing protein [Muribaculaceae bacterium]|nr:PepSY-like domain-containing protein [Muribaculaceae bacterium]
MKKIIVLGTFAMVLLMTACSDKPVTPAELPADIAAFVQQNFPGQNITFAKKDLELTGWQYDIVLADGTQIDFDTDQMWDKIQCTMASPVPTALIPAPIVSHLQSNFPDAMILKIDKEHNGYEIELANGLELKFNNEGALMEVDD